MSTEGATFYPRLLGTRGAVACHHYLACDAAVEILKSGGNAADAAVAAVLIEGLTNPHMHTLGGECPVIVCAAGDRRVHVINGNTAAPRRATPEQFRSRGLDMIPDEGILAAGVPAAFSALLKLLLRFGRLPFAAVCEPARHLAATGFPAHRGLLKQERYGIADLAEKFRRNWAGSADLYLRDGAEPLEGELIRNPALAQTLEHLARAERSAGGSRETKLTAVEREFYCGDIAAEIAAFAKKRDGLLEREDLANFTTVIENAVSVEFAGTELFKCGFWTQGPALLQTLTILDQFDVTSLTHNSADYLHLLIEATKLAYADREQWYGDPRQVEVPGATLLSEEYAALRARLIDPERASAAMQPGEPREKMRELLAPAEILACKPWGPGTVHVDIIDSDGCAVSATPSGGWLKSSEVVAALGFPLGNRMMTFYLDPPSHPNRVAPQRRPRTTISPSLGFRDGRPWMAFGSMGGDQQDQWQLQFFLNCVVFGMHIQEAIEAPKLSSEHFPGFFAPHDRSPRRVRAEPRLPAEALEDLVRRGHDVDVGPDWSEGFLLAAAFDPVNGLFEAGCDPRCTKSEIFPASARCW